MITTLKIRFKKILILCLILQCHIACVAPFKGTLPKQPNWLKSAQVWQADDVSSCFMVGQSDDFVLIEGRKNAAVHQAKEQFYQKLLAVFRKKVSLEIEPQTLDRLAKNLFEELVFQKDEFYYDAPNHIQFVLLRLDQQEFELKLKNQTMKMSMPKPSMEWFHNHQQMLFKAIKF